MCLSNIYRDNLKPRIIAKHAFVHATMSGPTYDRTAFANDSDRVVTLQSFLEALEVTEVEDIPLSCKHLAIFHTFANENGSCNIRQFLQKMKQIKDIQEVDDKLLLLLLLLNAKLNLKVRN